MAKKIPRKRRMWEENSRSSRFSDLAFGEQKIVTECENTRREEVPQSHDAEGNRGLRAGSMISSYRNLVRMTV